LALPVLKIGSPHGGRGGERRRGGDAGKDKDFLLHRGRLPTRKLSDFIYAVPKFPGLVKLRGNLTREPVFNPGTFFIFVIFIFEYRSVPNFARYQR
jgi:hypothetical protein